MLEAINQAIVSNTSPYSISDTIVYPYLESQSPWSELRLGEFLKEVAEYLSGAVRGRLGT